MQVRSILWPDVKSQKISEHRFRLIGPSVAQEPTQIHSRQTKTSVDQTRQPRTARQRMLGTVGASGRPADLARGPHCLSQATCCLLVGPLGRFGESHPVAPCYKYNGGWRIGHTHTHTTHHSPLLSCIPCIVFRLSGV